jgi:hypothetical protein
MTDMHRLIDDSPRIYRHFQFWDGQSGPIDDKNGRTGLIADARRQESIFSNPSPFV